MRRLFLFLLAVCLAPRIGSTFQILVPIMAGRAAAAPSSVSLDTSCNSGAPVALPAGNQLTCTPTIAADAKVVLIWAVVASTARAVSTVTVGARSGTLVYAQPATIDSSIELWKVSSPPTGAQAVTVTWAGGATAAMGVLSIKGGAGTLGTAEHGTGTTTPATLTVSSAAGHLVVDGVVTGSNSCASQTLTPNVSQTSVINNCANFMLIWGASTKPGAASVVLNWAIVGEANWAEIAVDVS